MEGTIRVGCIADDFTGASDAASFLRRQGMKTVLFNGLPEEKLPENCDAIVVALKSRTAPVKEAVNDSIQALKWMKAQGAAQLYIKYCSTFDSTKEGNIGPILDAALETFDIPYTLVCPSLPVNGRTVKEGSLFVNGIPLHESHMKNHPLTPMWASDITVLMKEQSKYPCMKLSIQELREGKEAVLAKVEKFAAEHPRFYIVPDYYEDAHAELILGIFGDLSLMTGGSGLLGAEAFRKKAAGEAKEEMTVPAEKSLLLAGSCSKATLEQIDTYQKAGGFSVHVDPLRLLNGEVTVDSLWEEGKGASKVLYYSSDKADNVKKVQEAGREKVAELLEQTMSTLAQRAVKDGYTQVIVAGGETSGAVTQGLGYQSYLIGESVAPGVPVMTPAGNRALRLVLKSGNFGQPDFFERVVKMTTEGKRGE